MATNMLITIDDIAAYLDVSRPASGQPLRCFCAEIPKTASAVTRTAVVRWDARAVLGYLRRRTSLTPARKLQRMRVRQSEQSFHIYWRCGSPPLTKAATAT